MSIEGRDKQNTPKPQRREDEGARRGEDGRKEDGEAGLLFAPAERYVYSRAIGPRTALQRSAMWGLSESRCFTGD